MPEHKPLYLYSLKEAAEWDEKDEWRESYLENCDCARAIERAIDEHYDGQRLNSCAQEIIDRYGFDRVNFVLAATVRQGTHDGRYSEDNKKWSKRFSVLDKENAARVLVNCGFDTKIRGETVDIVGFAKISDEISSIIGADL